jgi:vancomycin resistance protein YoaR
MSAALHVEAHVEAQLAALRLRRRRQARVRMLKRLALGAVAALAVAALALGVGFAGSPDRIASGVTVAGVDVGGMTADRAELVLTRRAAAAARRPIALRARGSTFRLTPAQLGLSVDWGAAARAALDRGDGFSPLRGFKRLWVSSFGSEVAPTAVVDRKRLEASLDTIARKVDRPHRDAAIRLRGLDPEIVAGRTGVVIDRAGARAALVERVTTLSGAPVVLTFKSDHPAVTPRTLRPALRQTERALSAPVRLTLGPTSYRLPRWRLAKMLDLPENGARRLRIAGPGADAYFGRLAKVVDTPSKDAGFEPLAGGKVSIIPSVDARVLDTPRTARNLLTAALEPAPRTAEIAVGTKAAERTTSEAQAMGITGLVSSYTTQYGGIANRIHNVQVVARLIDDTLVEPGGVFSFNGTTGERNEAKGFLAAPVIINGELQTALGGGVCQVSTTVFNAAYEAGLPITQRTNHYLYISHYPQGRDATVNYPDLDLKFVNDTGHWLLLRSYVGSSSLTVNLYGTPTGRRVESETAPLRVVGAPPTEVIKDPTLLKGKQVIEATGSPALATSVHRRVYDASGRLLHDSSWYSSYRGEKRIVRVGTKPKPKPKPKPVKGPLPPDRADVLAPVVAETPAAGTATSQAAAPEAEATPATSDGPEPATVLPPP